MMTTRTCSKCKRELDISMFSWRNRARGLFESQCKECKSSSDKGRHNRWYARHKEYADAWSREYYKGNKELINLKVREREKNHSKELGFSRYNFHARAKYYVKTHKLRPKECPICGKSQNILMHHPSYESFDKWSDVVFCCKGCHYKIHNGEIECPKPINLLLLSKR